MKKFLVVLGALLIIGSQFPNITEAANVIVGDILVSTMSISLSKDIYEVKCVSVDENGNQKGHPFFVAFTKMNGEWKYRDAAWDKDPWENVSGNKRMNDVLYVVLHKEDFE